MKIKLYLLLSLFLLNLGCKDDKVDTSNLEVESNAKVETLQIESFLKKFPKLKKYQVQLDELYKEQQNKVIWHSDNELEEFASVLYTNLNNAVNNDITDTIPYLKDFNTLFSNKESSLSVENKDLLISSMYLYYADHFYEGTDYNTSKLGWYLPRKKIDYIQLLDSIIENPNTEIEKIALIEQYDKLNEKLKLYNEIDKKGGWKKITLNKSELPIKFGDSSETISLIKKRFIVSGEINNENTSNFFDESLKFAIHKFQNQNNLKIDDMEITAELIEKLNISVSDRIETILVNMERCRWIDPKLFSNPEYIFVNIPSYELNYYKNKIVSFNTNVVVGKNATKTVIFSGNMSNIVFSPYWNLPQSIIKNEVEPGIEKDKNYLSKHHMEWNDGNVRQIPGAHNSLGLVKFIFPNTNNIYLHDTPSKSLFKKEDRAFSHGCIRVENPEKLALEILENYPGWDSDKIYKAMHQSYENSFILKEKIPVVIGYFTAWVNERGELIFYDDVYKRDKKLARHM